jgi:hypothetical protein
MRRGLWVVGLVLGLCGARPAWAQSTSAWMTPAGPIQNQPIDTSAWQAPPLTPGAAPFWSFQRWFPSFGKTAKKRRPRPRINPMAPMNAAAIAG